MPQATPWMDAVLCALQAAWANSRRASDFGIDWSCDSVEGWIAEPKAFSQRLLVCDGSCEFLVEYWPVMLQGVDNLGAVKTLTFFRIAPPAQEPQAVPVCGHHDTVIILVP